MIARKVRKCPLSPVVTSNVVLSGLVRLADILARLVQMADSLFALQLTGALFTINWGTLCQTHLPPHSPLPLPPASAPPPPPLLHLLDRYATPALLWKRIDRRNVKTTEHCIRKIWYKHSRKPFLLSFCFLVARNYIWNCCPSDNKLIFKAYLYQLEKYYQLKLSLPFSTYKSLACLVASSSLQTKFSPEIFEVYVYQL